MDPKKSCEAKVKRSLERCGKVRFLVEALENIGCPLPENYIRCEQCDMKVISGEVLEFEIRW